MARISVYVTDELKARMDGLGDRVNWSEAAQAAFEREIASASMPDDPGLDQVIERLRKSKANSSQANLAQARERGRDWAKKHASYNQLRTAVRLHLIEQGHYASQFDRVTFEEDSGEPGGYFYSTYGEPQPPDEYVEAFLKGVKDVWAQVADKI
jgi:hypothetical protein